MLEIKEKAPFELLDVKSLFSNSQILDNIRHLMDKNQLISMIHFLEKREEASKKENEDLKELLKSLQEEYKEDAEQNQRLLKTIEALSQQISDVTEENMILRQKVDELLSQNICRNIK